MSVQYQSSMLCELNVCFSSTHLNAWSHLLLFSSLNSSIILVFLFIFEHLLLFISQLCFFSLSSNIFFSLRCEIRIWIPIIHIARALILLICLTVNKIISLMNSVLRSALSLLPKVLRHQASVKTHIPSAKKGRSGLPLMILYSLAPG